MPKPIELTPRVHAPKPAAQPHGAEIKKPPPAPTYVKSPPLRAIDTVSLGDSEWEAGVQRMRDVLGAADRSMARPKAQQTDPTPPPRVEVPTPKPTRNNPPEREVVGSGNQEQATRAPRQLARVDRPVQKPQIAVRAYGLGPNDKTRIIATGTGPWDAKTDVMFVPRVSRFSRLSGALRFAGGGFAGAALGIGQMALQQLIGEKMQQKRRSDLDLAIDDDLTRRHSEYERLRAQTDGPIYIVVRVEEEEMLFREPEISGPTLSSGGTVTSLLGAEYTLDPPDEDEPEHSFFRDPLTGTEVVRVKWHQTYEIK